MREFPTVARGILLPFRRAGSGVVTGTGIEVIITQLQLVLSTVCASEATPGELDYHQDLGALLDRIRHEESKDPATWELAVHYITDKIKTLVPRVRLKQVAFIVDSEETTLSVRLGFDILDPLGLKAIAENLEEVLQL